MTPQRRATVPARRSLHRALGRHRGTRRDEPANQQGGRHRSPKRRQRAAPVGASALVGIVVAATALVQGAGNPSDTATTSGPSPSSTVPDAASEAASARSPEPVPDASVRDRQREPVSRSGQRKKAVPLPDPSGTTPDWLEVCQSVVADDTSANGRIPDENLCGLNGGPLHLRSDAADAFWRLSERYEARFGQEPCVTDGYRDIGAQERLYATKPQLAAKPGTSNHGWGIAVDLCGGVESFSTEQHAWLSDNARAFGWTNPDWARATGSKPEPWHWEYVD